MKLVQHRDIINRYHHMMIEKYHFLSVSSSQRILVWIFIQYWFAFLFVIIFCQSTVGCGKVISVIQRWHISSKWAIRLRFSDFFFCFDFGLSENSKKLDMNKYYNIQIEVIDKSCLQSEPLNGAIFKILLKCVFIAFSLAHCPPLFFMPVLTVAVINTSFLLCDPESEHKNKKKKICT